MLFRFTTARYEANDYYSTLNFFHAFHPSNSEGFEIQSFYPSW